MKKYSIEERIEEKFISENRAEHEKAKENSTKFMEVIKEMSEEGQTKAVWDAMNYAVGCIKKDVPANVHVTKDDDWYICKCPGCGTEQHWQFTAEEDVLDNYCYNCGQRLSYVFDSVVDDGKDKQ